MDRTTAEKFLAAGATVERCRQIFDAIMAPMAGKKQQPPSALKYFERIVPEHIGEAAKPLPEVAKAEGESYASLTSAQQAELRTHVSALIREGKSAEEAAKLARERLESDDDLVGARPDFLRRQA